MKRQSPWEWKNAGAPYGYHVAVIPTKVSTRWYQIWSEKLEYRRK